MRCHGSLLAGYSLDPGRVACRDVSGTVAALFGAGLFARAATNLPTNRLIGKR